MTSHSTPAKHSPTSTLVDAVSAFKGKRVLITGINGFLGSHLARALVDAGARVEGISRTPEHTPYLDAFFTQGKPLLHALDLREKEAVLDFFRAQAYDYIFHLASQADTWKSAEMPLETFETNVGGTLYLMEGIRQSKKQGPVILSGSVRAFEYTNAITRGAPPSMHLYDASKFGMEMIASSYFHTYGLPGAIAQNTNMYGENDRNYNRLIPKIMHGLASEGSITLRGTGNVKRDFMYVGDAVQGILALAARVHLPSVQGNAFTFASGKLCAVKEVAAAIEKLLRGNGHITFDGKALSDRDQHAFEIDSTKELLGWQPRVGLEEGLERTWQWYVAHEKNSQNQFRRNQS